MLVKKIWLRKFRWEEKSKKLLVEGNFIEKKIGKKEEFGQENVVKKIT